jgi:hypothetical protein
MRKAKQHLINFIKGAGVLVAISALLYALFFVFRASLRVSFGRGNCDEFYRSICVMEPTLFDKLAFYGVCAFCFIIVSIFIGSKFRKT